MLLAALLVSGPIRQHLWKAELVFWLVLLLCVALVTWLSIPGAVENLN